MSFTQEEEDGLKLVLKDRQRNQELAAIDTQMNALEDEKSQKISEVIINKQIDLDNIDALYDPQIQKLRDEKEAKLIEK